MTEHLTPLDATFLELEQADESAHMHIGGLLVFEASEAGPPSLEQVKRRLEERLPALPRYRQRLSDTHTGGLTWPSWVAHEHFDIADHIRHAALPAPGGHEELCEWAADFWSHRLDRRLPLWEVVLIDGLADGRWALATKTHHCMVDGVGSIGAAYLLIDFTADESAPPPAAVPHLDRPSGHGPLSVVPRLAAHAALTGLGIALHPQRLTGALHRSRAALQLLVQDELVGAPHTSLCNPIGTRRRYTTVSVDLGEVKRIKGALGGTVNDVALAAVTSGLRRVLERRGESLPSQGLRAMVPVNVRTEGERLGNHISSLFVHLPVAEADAADRYRATVKAAESLKSGNQATGSETLVDLAGLVPPMLHGTLAQSLFASRLFNLTVTNVPGPQIPLYAFGSQMSEALPFVPLAAEHAIGVAILSYDGTLAFGLCGDHETMPDIEVCADGIRDCLAELGTRAGGLTEALGQTG